MGLGVRTDSIMVGVYGDEGGSKVVGVISKTKPGWEYAVALFLFLLLGVMVGVVLSEQGLLRSN